MVSQQHELTPEGLFTIFIIIIIFVVFLLVIVLVQCCSRTVENIRNPLDKQHFSTKWTKIRQEYGINDTRPLAIIHANSLLDDALKKRKYSGDTMHQRLVSAQRVFKYKNEVWYANQLRNQIVHDVNMTSWAEADMRRALQGFRQALVDLGAIDNN